MNFIKINPCDIANGEGIRVSLWVAGCEHYCPGCHNPQTWDSNNGIEFTLDDLVTIEKALRQDNITGISFTGGDPLNPKNKDMITSISNYLKRNYPNKTQWLWTGYKWEDICDYQIINNIDVLIDGEYIEEERDITLKWRGSKNQRVIDVKQSIISKSIILYCD